MKDMLREYFNQMLDDNIDIDTAKDNLMDLVVEIADEVYDIDKNIIVLFNNAMDSDNLDYIEEQLHKIYEIKREEIIGKE